MQPRQPRGFTVMELLIVIAILVILASLLLPALGRAKENTRRIACISNLKQISAGMHSFAADHDDVFPWRLPVDAGGSFTRSRVFETYLAMRRQLSTPKILVCPSDKRQVAENWSALRDTNTSYFIGADTREEKSRMLLTGDWNLEGTRKYQDCPIAGVLKVTDEIGWPQVPKLFWGTGVHRKRGNIALGDGSAHQVDMAQTREFLGSTDD